MIEIQIATGSGKGATDWKNNEVDWYEFLNTLKKPRRGSLTIKEYHRHGNTKKGKQIQANEKNGKSFVSGLLSGKNRSKKNIVTKQVVTLDSDTADEFFIENVRRALPKYEWFAYTTHSHTEEAPRWRLLVLLKDPIEAAQYQPVARRIAEDIGMDYWDRTTFDVNRLMFYPSVCADAKYLKHHNKTGKALSGARVLDTYEDATDLSAWPRCPDEQGRITDGMQLKGDPHEKPGWIGAMCRVISISQLLEEDELMSEIYEQDDNSGHWTFLAGEGVSGGKIYNDDKFFYSHHSTDPAGGELHNAYDLRRIHAFGHLDANAEEGTPINKLPSIEAMDDWCSKQDDVKVEYAKWRLMNTKNPFSDLIKKQKKGDGEDSGDPIDIDWLGELDTTGKGIFKTTAKNFKLVLSNDPLLKDKIGYNMFTKKMSAKGALPWNTDERTRWWTKRDWAGLREYLNNAPYEFTRSQLLEDVMDGSFVQATQFHPVKDFIESREWDGKNRIETLFIDYLGAADTEYTRQVTRKSLVACVARIYDPGCKFDEELVLVGPEGKGKSTILQRLGHKWFTDSFHFGLLTGGNGKMAFEAIKGQWIIETPEMAGLSNADDKAAKLFLGSQEDKYRPSHEPEEVCEPRQCVFFGTTNNDDFLRNNNGNRRFWPVPTHVDEHGNSNPEVEPKLSVWDDLPVKVIRQIWAEAYKYYQAGEELFLADRVAKDAKAMQDEHTQVDARTEMIDKFLSMPVPDDWETYSFLEKYNYFSSNVYEGKRRISDVSAIQIWIECLGGQRNAGVPSAVKFIHDYLSKRKDFRKESFRSKLTNYGKQQRYLRISGNKVKNETKKDNVRQLRKS